ncbi:hypothetical protein IX307_001644 [Bacteroides pyogenes]|nr:hypothetical protein [Bacteroides pyogenes]MBR8739528.1 hypothetical protein [Bacteroides pyogenes]MBR8755352.1 hypothetical protein [Bacteroides pyogenes]MBR8787319.1 hypothetical protein [Bacteroides pyogenes]MBR8792817.1 hypothetical protein [Bacteroides pyogenes]
MTQRTYEELVQLREEERIGWLQFALECELAEDFMQWCRDHGTIANEDTAQFYLEMVEQTAMDRQILDDDDYRYDEW